MVFIHVFIYTIYIFGRTEHGSVVHPLSYEKLYFLFSSTSIRQVWKDNNNNLDDRGQLKDQTEINEDSKNRISASRKRIIFKIG